MRIAHMNLLEAQGITQTLVEAYLTRTGWTPSKDGVHWERNSDLISGWSPESQIATINGISRVENRSPQLILREINPLLRPWPSAEAIAAHDGPWLCVCVEDETACMGKFDGHWFKHSGNHVIEQRDRWAMFWPCDRFLQRVRWPERDGVML